jgi:DNA-binding LytR/AlgR family response regulator
VIITSAYQEYALESYELDVCDYLLKPFRFDRFLKAVNKALQTHRLQTSANRSSSSSSDPTPQQSEQLFLKADGKHVNVALSDIHYLESYGNYVKVWLNGEHHLTLRTLSSFEEQLPADHFIRIHKSFMVNKQYVDYLEGNRVYLQNGMDIPIGKSRKEAFLSFMDPNID